MLMRLFALAAAAAGFMFFKGSEPVKLEEGLSYRFTVDVKPKLADSELDSLAGGLAVAGLSGVELWQESSSTRASFNGPPEAETRTVKPGDIVVGLAGHELLFVTATKIS